MLFKNTSKRIMSIYASGRGFTVLLFTLFPCSLIAVHSKHRWSHVKELPSVLEPIRAAVSGIGQWITPTRAAWSRLRHSRWRVPPAWTARNLLSGKQGSRKGRQGGFSITLSYLRCHASMGIGCAISICSQGAKLAIWNAHHKRPYVRVYHHPL